MKKLLIISLLLPYFLLACFASGVAQNKMGDNPTTLDDGSLLELESTTKALVPPRMTTTQMNAIPTPLVGAVVFNTTEDCLYQYSNNNSWESLCDPVEPYLRAHQSVAQTFANNTLYTVQFQTETEDNRNAFNGTQYTIPENGTYIITTQVSFNVGGIDHIMGSIDIVVNGQYVAGSRGTLTPDQTGNIGYATASTGKVIKLNTGDVVSVNSFLFNSSGHDTQTGEAATSISISKI